MIITSHPTPFILEWEILQPVEELAKVENVQGVEDLGDRKFRVRFENAQEAMDSIVKQSVVHDWHLSEIRVEKTSLDKIFSRLSKKIQ